MTTSRRLPLAGLLLTALFCCGAEDRGVVLVESAGGEQMALYDESHALLIGISRYDHWPDLESIPDELARVRGALEKQGFQVKQVADVGGDALRAEIRSFLATHGRAVNNRLLIYFAGHGHTIDGPTGDPLGYIVPCDAPLPSADEAGFQERAVSMITVRGWAQEIRAKHVLFLFDSCFSGSIFEARGGKLRPPVIDKLTAEPVRMFITAGSANESVPARSDFALALVDALEARKGDLNGDDYVTGMELGMYLQAEISKYGRQTPQYGKIDIFKLARGDFVFALGPERPPEPDAWPLVGDATFDSEVPVGWSVGSFADASVQNWRIAVTEDVYRWDVAWKVDRECFVRLPYRPTGDFYAAIDVRYTSGSPTVALLFGWDLRNTYLAFKMTAKGVFALLSSDGARSSWVVDWRQAKLDPGTFNRVAVRVRGGTITLLLNHTELERINVEDIVRLHQSEASAPKVTVDQLTQGMLGLQVEGTAGASATVDFDRFEYRERPR